MNKRPKQPKMLSFNDIYFNLFIYFFLIKNLKFSLLTVFI